MGRLFRILSIDGGGIRGIIAGHVLQRLEEELKTRSGDPNARIADYFDLIAGTSTGGILTCCYLTPDPGSTRPKYTAAEAVGFYLQRGPEVFHRKLLRKVLNFKGILDEKYEATGLESALDDYLGDVKLDQLLKPCIVTAYEIQKRKAFFFRQHRADDAANNFLVRDAARATSAAPTYFEPAMVRAQDRKQYALIDGGLFANNPTLCAYAEARNIAWKPTAAEMLILSLGTGELKKKFPYDEAKNWGAVSWVLPVLDIMMSGVAETVSYQLEQMFDAVGKPDQYLRVTPDLGKARANEDMDDASEKNMKACVRAGEQAWTANESRLKTFAQRLVDAAH